MLVKIPVVCTNTNKLCNLENIGVENIIFIEIDFLLLVSTFES